MFQTNVCVRQDDVDETKHFFRGNGGKGRRRARAIWLKRTRKVHHMWLSAFVFVCSTILPGTHDTHKPNGNNLLMLLAASSCVVHIVIAIAITIVCIDNIPIHCHIIRILCILLGRSECQSISISPFSFPDVSFRVCVCDDARVLFVLARQISIILQFIV